MADTKKNHRKPTPEELDEAIKKSLETLEQPETPIVPEPEIKSIVV